MSREPVHNLTACLTLYWQVPRTTGPGPFISVNQARSFPREGQVACSCRQGAVSSPKSSRGSRTREPPQGSVGGFSSAAAAPLRGCPQASPAAAGVQLAGVWARRHSGPAPRSHQAPAVLVPRPEFRRSGRAPAAGVAANGCGEVPGSGVPATP